MVAFVIAGQARSFLDERGWQTYHQHVLKSFYANAESRVFLHLKLGRGPNLNRRWQELSRAVDGLRPAVVRTTLQRDVEVRESVFDRAGSRARAHPRHPECFWRDVAPHFQLSRAGIWWLTMEQAWESVASYERDNGFTFDAVVFSRPDITFHKAMGPWCGYDLKRQWYAPWGEMTPDMLWVFPRAVASKVLTTWTQVVLRCQPGQPCCNLSSLEGEQSLGGGRSPNIALYDNTRVTYSNWIATYWSRALKGDLEGGGLNYSLRGHGQVAANPNRVIHGKPRRNVSALPR